MDAARCYWGEAPFCDTSELAPGRVHFKKTIPGMHFMPLYPIVFPRGRFASTVGADSESLSDEMTVRGIHERLLRRSDGVLIFHSGSHVHT